MLHFWTKIFRREEDFSDNFLTAQNLGCSIVSFPLLSHDSMVTGPSAVELCGCPLDLRPFKLKTDTPVIPSMRELHLH